jgi:nitrous oxidase accessory protein
MWAGICTGEGTKTNPYVIQNLIIDAKNSTNGIYIRTTDEYFIVRNCKVYNSGDMYAGILIEGNNGLLTNNNASNNLGPGISVYGSNNTISKNTVNENSDGINIGGNNNIISGNKIDNNYAQGIYVRYGENFVISGNKISNNWNGLVLYHSDYNLISENIEHDNRNCGILFGWSDYNKITGNEAFNNLGDGMYMIASSYNDIISNQFNNNSEHGVGILSGNYNAIQENLLYKNLDTGVYIRYYSSYNNITYNCFVNNTVNAHDEGYNFWDDGSRGNYWSDYTGVDLDEDGIGDVPYNITGSYGGITSKDNFPLMECPISYPVGGRFPIELTLSISIISGGAVIGVLATLLIIRKRKKIQ